MLLSAWTSHTNLRITHGICWNSDQATRGVEAPDDHDLGVPSSPWPNTFPRVSRFANPIRESISSIVLDDLEKQRKKQKGVGEMQKEGGGRDGVFNKLPSMEKREKETA
jgi:hypothetical protein